MHLILTAQQTKNEKQVTIISQLNSIGGLPGKGYPQSEAKLTTMPSNEHVMGVLDRIGFRKLGLLNRFDGKICAFMVYSHRLPKNSIITIPGPMLSSGIS
jgi:hypothetical protein